MEIRESGDEGGGGEVAFYMSELIRGEWSYAIYLPRAFLGFLFRRGAPGLIILFKLFIVFFPIFMVNNMLHQRNPTVVQLSGRRDFPVDLSRLQLFELTDLGKKKCRCLNKAILMVKDK